jgi:glycosyltransferase involved in cell wall biosynthesis
VVDLSVVLISKNQEWNVARLIESVLEETNGIRSREIVLVDSASVDETVEIAKNHAIDIIRLQPTQTLTPAAGRYAGYHYTSGELLLFLDGDMELCSGWLEKALRLIKDRQDVAVVTGPVIDLPMTSSPHEKPPLDDTGVEAATEAPFAGGAALYRRSVLKQVGTFNPYLHSDEEPELCLRIRHAGYRILRLEYPVAYHYSSSSKALSTLIGRRQRNLYLGLGQNIRCHLDDELLWPYIRERGFGLVAGLGLAVGLVNFLWSTRTRRWRWFGLWLLMLSAIIVGDVYRKRSPYRTLFALVHRLFVLDGTIRGFLMQPLHPDSFPRDHQVIQVSGPGYAF